MSECRHERIVSLSPDALPWCDGCAQIPSAQDLARLLAEARAEIASWQSVAETILGTADVCAGAWGKAHRKLEAERDAARERVDEGAHELHRLAVELGLPDAGPQENVSAAVAEAKGLREAADWLNSPFDPAKTCGPITPPDGAFVAGWKEAWYTIGSQFRATLAPPEPAKEAK